METLEQRSERIAALEERRAGRVPAEGVEDRALTRESLPESMLPPVVAGQSIGPSSALRVADAFACVRLLAESAATLPLVSYRRRADGGRDRAPDLAGARLLERPSPAVRQADFVGQMVAHLNLHGDAYVGKYRDDTGAVAQLGCVDPATVQPRIVGGLRTYMVSGGPRGTVEVTDADIIHVRALSVDGLRGLSPVAQARQALGYASALAEHGAAVMANGATVPGVVQVLAGPGADDQVKALKEGFQGRHAGPKNAGRMAFVTGEVKVTPLGMPLADAEFVAQRQLSTQEVARIFRVPSWMIGGPSGDSMTYSNVGEQARAFVTFALRPWLTYIEQALTADDELYPGDAFAEFLLDDLLRGDAQARAATYTQALNPQTGWMTRDEVRRLENLSPEPQEAHTA